MKYFVVVSLLLPAAVGFAAATSAPPATVTAPAVAADFARYQVIIDRSPFGTVTAEGAAAGQMAPFAAKYQFVGLVTSNATEGQPLQAIVFDKEANRTFFKSEGESLGDAADPAKIVRIEQAPPKLVLQHGLETASLGFPERSNAPGPPGAPGVAPNPNLPPGFPQPHPGMPTPPKKFSENCE